MIIATPNIIGRATSFVARRTESTGDSCLPSSRRCTEFSIMTTAPSTIIPKSIAPRLMRLALMPNNRMPAKLTSIEKGMIDAVTIAARMLPRNRRRTTVTSRNPSNSFFITQRSALPGSRADRHLSEVAQQDRSALICQQDDLSQFIRCDCAAASGQRVLLGCVLDIAATEIPVVLLDPHRDIVKRQSVLLQQRRLDLDLELLCFAAPRIDFADSRDGAELALDGPLLHVFEFHCIHGTAQGVLKQLTERRCRQTQRRLKSHGQP